MEPRSFLPALWATNKPIPSSLVRARACEDVGVWVLTRCCWEAWTKQATREQRPSPSASQGLHLARVQAGLIAPLLATRGVLNCCGRGTPTRAARVLLGKGAESEWLAVEGGEINQHGRLRFYKGGNTKDARLSPFGTW